MTFATDRTDDSSWLLVIPVQDPASGPVARLRIPVGVPLGLHGAWLPRSNDVEAHSGGPEFLSGTATTAGDQSRLRP